MNCPECGVQQFRCRSSQCINGTLVCNGIKDCDDNTDEISCCPENQFRCSLSGLCVEEKRRCDGVYDCGEGDNSDEVNSQCSESYASTTKANQGGVVSPFVFAVLGIIVVGAIIAAFVYCHCKRKSNNSLRNGKQQQATTGQPRPVADNLVPQIPPSHHPQRHVPIGSSEAGRIGRILAGAPPPPNTIVQDDDLMSNVQGGSSNGMLYDRSHVTGASSSSSSGFRHQCTNPPPSPSTTIRPPAHIRTLPNPAHHHHTHGHHRSLNSLSRRQQQQHRGPSSAYRYYTHRTNPPAPVPTPCSTDINEEESDSYAAPIPHQMRPHFPSAANSVVGYDDSESYMGGGAVGPHCEGDGGYNSPSNYLSDYGGGFEEDLPEERDEYLPGTPPDESTLFLNSHHLPEPPPPSRVPSPTPLGNVHINNLNGNSS